MCDPEMGRTGQNLPSPASQGCRLARPVWLADLESHATSRSPDRGKVESHTDSPFSRAAWEGAAPELSAGDPEGTPQRLVLALACL